MKCEWNVVGFGSADDDTGAAMVQKHYQPNLDVLGPEHDGLRLDLEAFDRAAGEDGYRFELIEGVLRVSPSPEPYSKDVAVAVFRLLEQYNASRPRRVFEAIVWEPRVFVSDDPRRTTNPQPDVAAYTRYPQRPVRSYRGLYPAMVVEVVSSDSAYKDYVRNRDLYMSCDEIVEYWIVDPRSLSEPPSMTVHRRQAGGAEFERVDVPAGGTYESLQWPGLAVDLARIARE